jgi:hypothetical protein
MHAFLFASTFVLIVLTPCIVAMRVTGLDPGE